MVTLIAAPDPQQKVPNPGETPGPIVPDEPSIPSPGPGPPISPDPPFVPQPDPDRDVPIEPPAAPQTV